MDNYSNENHLGDQLLPEICKIKLKVQYFQALSSI